MSEEQCSTYLYYSVSQKNANNIITVYCTQIASVQIHSVKSLPSLCYCNRDTSASRRQAPAAPHIHAASRELPSPSRRLCCLASSSVLFIPGQMPDRQQTLPSQTSGVRAVSAGIRSNLNFPSPRANVGVGANQPSCSLGSENDRFQYEVGVMACFCSRRRFERVTVRGQQ